MLFGLPYPYVRKVRPLLLGVERRGRLRQTTPYRKLDKPTLKDIQRAVERALHRFRNVNIAVPCGQRLVEAFELDVELRVEGFSLQWQASCDCSRTVVGEGSREFQELRNHGRDEQQQLLARGHDIDVAAARQFCERGCFGLWMRSKSMGA